MLLIPLFILVAIPTFQEIFRPVVDLPAKALAAFISSMALLLVVVCAALPWIALFLLLSWLFLKFLRWWIRRKREAKEKNRLNSNSTPH